MLDCRLTEEENHMRPTLAIHIPHFAIWSALGDYGASEQGGAAEREAAPDETTTCMAADHCAAPRAEMYSTSMWSEVQFAHQPSACVYCDYPISVGEAYCSMLIEGQPAPIHAHYSCTED